MVPHSADQPKPLAAALSAYRSGQLADSRRLCSRMLEDSPGHPGALQLMARLSMEAGDGESALEWLQQALDQTPENPQLLYDQAQLLLHLGRDQDARSRFETILVRAPQHLQARLQLASSLHRDGHIEAALGHYRQALEQAPELAELHCQIGVCEFQLGHPQAARGWFQSCLKLEPGHLDALENLGRSELEAREFQAARDTLEAVLAKAPLRGQSHHLLGFVHLHLGDIEAAAGSFLAPVRERFARHGPGGEEPADPDQVTETKLRHDLEQLEYLAQRDLLAPQCRDLPLRFRQALASLPESSPQRFFFRRPQVPGFVEYYNRLLEDYRPSRVPGAP